MKIRVTINVEPIHIDEVIEASSEDEILQKFRRGAEKRAPLLVKLAMRSMSDEALLRQIVQSYNHKFEANEPIPSTAKEFIAFGERVGFFTRL